MHCMSCHDEVPSTHDICDECFEEAKATERCPVCGGFTQEGACFDIDCTRNDFSLREAHAGEHR